MREDFGGPRRTVNVVFMNKRGGMTLEYDTLLVPDGPLVLRLLS